MTEMRALAEHYVLGWLDEGDRATVEARIASPASDEDRALAAEIAEFAQAWAQIDGATPVQPMSPGAWDRIESAIAKVETPDPADGSVVPMRGRDPQARQTGSRGPWRAVAGLAIAASVALAALLLFNPFAPSPLVMAILLDDDGNSVAVVEAFGDDSVRVTPLVSVDAGGNRVLQIWTKPDPDGPPVSVGILETAMRARLTGPDLPDPTQDQLYEITIEPPGGSPTGLPTGPIVGKGLAQGAL